MATNLPGRLERDALIVASESGGDASGILEHILASATPESVVRLPAGNFRISRTLTLPAVDLTLCGQGVTSTALIFDQDPAAPPGSFIKWVSTADEPGPRPGLQISDISLLTQSVQDGAFAALQIEYANEQYHTPSVKISRVRISPDFSEPNVGRFGNGIIMINCRQAILSDVWLFGRTEGQAAESRSRTGLLLSGECTDIRVENSVFYQWQVGLIVQGASEGVQLRDNSFIFLEIGVAVNAPGEPQFQAIGNNLNTSVAGLILLSPLGAMIANNTFYANNVEKLPTGGYVGIDIRQGQNKEGDVESRNNHIVNNTFFLDKNPPTPQYGISLNSKIKSTAIMGNTMEKYDGRFITLGTETRQNVVIGNIGERAEGGPLYTAEVDDKGQHNVKLGNIAF